MTATELLLLILGAGVFVVSFLIPQRNKPEESKEQIPKEQVKELFDQEMKGAKDTMLEMVNETVTYGVEKAERAMERLTNEKISAVSEFSDTVLSDINKNRDEVMFLYDMLNDKHENLKEAVAQVEQTTRKAYQANEELSEKMKVHPKEVPQPKGQVEKPGDTEVTAQNTPAFVPFEPVKLEKITPDEATTKEVEAAPKKTTRKRKKTLPQEETSKQELFIEGNVVNQGNNNEKILELHRMNKSNVAIAKELGLGVGEVKLVIDLYEGMK